VDKIKISEMPINWKKTVRTETPYVYETYSSNVPECKVYDVKIFRRHQKREFFNSEDSKIYKERVRYVGLKSFGHCSYYGKKKLSDNASVIDRVYSFYCFSLIAKGKLKYILPKDQFLQSLNSKRICSGVRKVMRKCKVLLCNDMTLKKLDLSLKCRITGYMLRKAKNKLRMVLPQFQMLSEKLENSSFMKKHLKNQKKRIKRYKMIDSHKKSVIEELKAKLKNLHKKAEPGKTVIKSKPIHGNLEAELDRILAFTKKERKSNNNSYNKLDLYEAIFRYKDIPFVVKIIGLSDEDIGYCAGSLEIIRKFYNEGYVCKFRTI
jgi:hypothetical protein